MPKVSASVSFGAVIEELWPRISVLPTEVGIAAGNVLWEIYMHGEDGRRVLREVAWARVCRCGREVVESMLTEVTAEVDGLTETRQNGDRDKIEITYDPLVERNQRLVQKRDRQRTAWRQKEDRKGTERGQNEDSKALPGGSPSPAPPSLPIPTKLPPLVPPRVGGRASRKDALWVLEDYPRRINLDRGVRAVERLMRRPETLGELQVVTVRDGLHRLRERVRDFAAVLQRFGVDESHEDWNSVPEASRWMRDKRYLLGEAEWSAAVREGKFVPAEAETTQSKDEKLAEVQWDWRELLRRRYDNDWKEPWEALPYYMKRELTDERDEGKGEPVDDEGVGGGAAGSTKLYDGDEEGGAGVVPAKSGAVE